MIRALLDLLTVMARTKRLGGCMCGSVRNHYLPVKLLVGCALIMSGAAPASGQGPAARTVKIDLPRFSIS